MGGLLVYLLGITRTNFDNLWILIVIATVFPLVTLLFLLVIPNKFDVNDEIDKYFKLKKKQDNKENSNKNSSSISKLKINGT